MQAAQSVPVHQILDLMPAGALLVGADGQIFYANLRAKHLFGKSTTSPVSLSDIAPTYLAGTSDALSVERLCAQAACSTSPSIHQLEICHADRRILVESWFSQFDRDERDVPRFLWVLTDIGDRHPAWLERCDVLRALEQTNLNLQTSSQLKDEFLQNASHEMRTPLNGAIGSLQLVLDGLCDSKEEEREMLVLAKQCSLHLLQLVNEILDLGRLEAGKALLEVRSVDLRATISAALYLQLANIQQKKLKLYRQEFPKPIKVSADPNKLKQVLINAIGNAVKYTDRGSITIVTDVRERSPEAEKPVAVIAIQDTGVGIDPVRLGNLFQRFSVADEDSAKSRGGTGLGLAISRRFIEMMGGAIEIESAGINQGTTLFIYLPLAIAN